MKTLPTPFEPTLDQHLCFALYSASMAVNRTYKPLLDRLRLTYPQYLVLNVLWEEDGRTVGAIADRLALESSTITPLVKRLEQAGLVARARNPKDERQVIVALSDAGRAMRAESRCLAEALITASDMTLDQLGRLNEQVRSFRNALANASEAGEPANA